MAKNVLSDEEEVSNQQEANFWLAENGKTDGQGFVMRVANSKRKIVGVKIRNTYNAGKSQVWATKAFELEGSLLKRKIFYEMYFTIQTMYYIEYERGNKERKDIEKRILC